MKSVSIIIVLFVLSFNMNLNAGFVGKGNSTKINTVVKVKYAEDGQLIILTGHIVEKIGDQSYLFKDDTGEIKVQIDNYLWGNIEVKSDTLIRIYGELGNGNLGNVDMVINKVEDMNTKQFGRTDVEVE